MRGQGGRGFAARAVVLCSVLGVGVVGSGCDEVAEPIVHTAALRVRQIYDAGEWLRRVPVALAVSFFARSQLENFIEELELPDEIRQRTLARVRADDFVDELVPFLMFLREMYTPPEGARSETLDDHLRARFTAGDAIPGIEHSMLHYGSDLGNTYSDMNQHGWYLGPFLWFKLYWGGVAVLMAVLSNLLWPRGVDGRIRQRFQSARSK